MTASQRSRHRALPAARPGAKRGTSDHPVRGPLSDKSATIESPPGQQHSIPLPRAPVEAPSRRRRLATPRRVQDAFPRLPTARRKRTTVPPQCPAPLCAPMPSTAKELERRVWACIRGLDIPLRKLGQKHSPPALIVALALQLNRLGQAHISAGLLTTEDMRRLIGDVCQFGSPAARGDESQSSEYPG